MFVAQFVFCVFDLMIFYEIFYGEGVDKGDNGIPPIFGLFFFVEILFFFVLIGVARYIIFKFPHIKRAIELVQKVDDVLSSRNISEVNLLSIKRSVIAGTCLVLSCVSCTFRQMFKTSSPDLFFYILGSCTCSFELSSYVFNSRKQKNPYNNFDHFYLVSHGIAFNVFFNAYISELLRRRLLYQTSRKRFETSHSSGIPSQFQRNLQVIIDFDLLRKRHSKLNLVF